MSSRPRAVPTSEHATRTMRANRGRDTSPEIRIRRLLHARGFRYRVNHRLDLPEGRVRPDIVFTRQRVAVFIDGCFWHGCPTHMSWPKGNAEFWAAKIAQNRERDARQDRWLRDAGWTVVRVWEHEAAASVVDRVVRSHVECSERVG